MAALYGWESSESSDSEEEATIDYGSVAHNARNYQLELFQHAKEKNSILVLGTGSGKTFIAILLIKHRGGQLSGTFPGEAKRSFMLCNTVPLVRQQAKAIKQHVGYSVQAYDGSMGVDIWDKPKWIEEMKKNEVLVMVSQIFLDMLKANYISWDQVNLLIVDECHHATGNHPMREVMRHYFTVQHTLKDPPRILGLTASIIQKKCHAYEVEKLFKDLEKSLGCSLVTTIHHEEVLKFTTKPTEIILHYHNERFTPPSEHAQAVVNNLNSMIGEIGSDNTIDKKSQKALARVLRNIIHALIDLGEWCGSRAIEHEIENFKELVVEEDLQQLRELMDLILSRLREIQAVCNAAEQAFVDLEQHVSHHVSILLKLLSNCCNGMECHALAFVETRATAFLLTELLNKLQTQGGLYGPLTARCVVGAAIGGKSYGDMAKASRNLAKQQETLNAFRTGQFNILISTSVLEEGVDIRKCNLVVRFNEPKNFRAFVQSKGRARAENSMYVLMVGPESKLATEISQYHNLEASFREVCRGRALPLPEESVESFNDDILPPYMPLGVHGPRVTSASSLNLIHKYCDKLPHDHFTALGPEIKTREVTNNLVCSFIATLKLPLSSPCNSLFVSDPMPTQEWAKKSVALKVCQVLHEAGELNESLLPFKNIKVNEELIKPIIGCDDAEDAVPGKVGSMKRRQVYERAVCTALSTPITRTCYLYHLRINHVVKVHNCENFYGSHNLGLLAAHRIVPCTFPLFNNKWGQIDVSIDCVKSFTLTSSEIEKIIKFNEFLFDFLLNVNNEVMQNSRDSKWQCLVVPLFTNLTLDTKLIDSIAKMGKMNLSEPLEEDRKKFSFSSEKYEDAIVVPWYKEREVYCVYKVTDETILSAVVYNRKAESYEQYFRSKYGLTIYCESQVMLDCRHVPTEMSCLAPVDAKRKERNSLHPRLVPELCHLLPIPAHLFFQACLLPSILHRLNGLNLTVDFITKVNELPRPFMPENALNVGSDKMIVGVEPIPDEPLQYDWCEKITKDVLASHPSQNVCVALLHNDFMRFDHFNSLMMSGCYDPEVMKIEMLRILQAFTPLKIKDCFNLERLEVLGDSFLKFHLGQMLFFEYPLWHEGRLSAHRSQYVSNNTLYKLGKKVNLPSFLQATQLTPVANGPAPGFVVRPAVAAELLKRSVPHQQWHSYRRTGEDTNDVSRVEDEDKFAKGCFDPWTQQCVPDKMVADSIEALLGSWLLNCGPCRTHQLLLMLGFPIDTAVQVPRSAVLDSRAELDIAAAHDEVNRLYKQHMLNRLEDIINYTFRDKSFLLQAVTHPTFSTNKVTHYYQRLEFLGDAVLDFLVTGHVFASPSLSPGRITDIRSHYVCNETLARACVAKEMHRFLQHHCVYLEGVIDGFVALVEGEQADELDASTSGRCVAGSQGNRKDSSSDEEAGAVETQAPASVLNRESDVLVADEVEVPKVLGDLVESIIGAVYLDSDLSLDVCWKLVQHLLPDLKSSSFDKVGIDCVRLMHENAEIENIEKKKPDDNKKVAEVWVKVKGVEQLVGRGKNLRSAKQAVAKLVLKHLYGELWYCAGKPS